MEFIIILTCLLVHERIVKDLSFRRVIRINKSPLFWILFLSKPVYTIYLQERKKEKKICDMQ